MINVSSKLIYTNGDASTYQSHVTIDGNRSEIACEIKALINSFIDDLELEDIYLSIATEIAKAHVEDLERTLEDLKND